MALALAGRRVLHTILLILLILLVLLILSVGIVLDLIV